MKPFLFVAISLFLFCVVDAVTSQRINGIGYIAYRDYYDSGRYSTRFYSLGIRTSNETIKVDVGFPTWDMVKVEDKIKFEYSEGGITGFQFNCRITEVYTK